MRFIGLIAAKEVYLLPLVRKAVDCSVRFFERRFLWSNFKEARDYFGHCSLELVYESFGRENVDLCVILKALRQRGDERGYENDKPDSIRSV